MTKREFSADKIKEMDYAEIDSHAWRHGRTANFVFEFGGQFWRFTANVHHDDGIQIEDTVMATLVHQIDKTVKVWEPLP